MAQLHVEAEGTSRATPDAVWRLVGDADRFAEWGPWDDGGYERPGDESARGVGAVQWFRTGRTTSVEQIVAVEEGRRLEYVLLRGIPVRNYRAVVTLTPVAEGTHVRWSADWDTTLLGRIVHRKLRSFYPAMMDQLVRAADQEALAR
jgi:uncharacterized protein YndB with AHSA1/START domain